MKKSIFFVFVLIMLTTVSAVSLDLELNSLKHGIELTAQDREALHFSAGISAIEQLTINTRSGAFSQLEARGFGYAGETGTPRLPVKRELIAVPLGAVPEVLINSYDSAEYGLSELNLLSVMPAQPPLPKSASPEDIEFAHDRAAYQKDVWFSNNIFSCQEIGILRGQRIFTVTYHPVAYNPAQNSLRIYNNVNATVTFVGSDWQTTEELRARTWSPAYENIYAKSLINYRPLEAREDITRYPIKYVIISDEMFEAQLQPFIDWKIQQGYNVIEAYTSQTGGTTAAIAGYIESLWEEATPTDPAPSFILFVGDTAQIPAYNGSQGSHVTDLNYVRLEGGDFMPEIYYGRFSARNIAELQPQIDKTLEYEMFSMPDASYLEEVVMIAGMDAYHGSQWGNGQINYGTSNYFNATHGITSHTYLYPVSGSSSGQIIQNVSDGVGYVNYTAHGSSTSWSDPSFTISNINNLNNIHEYPLAVGNCCLTNKFEVGECFGEAWLREEDGGSIGYIGGTNSTYWDEDFWWGVGSGNITSNPTYAGTGAGAYDGMFHDHGEIFADWYTAQAAFIMAGNLAVVQGGGMANYYWEIYSLMGDPSLNPYFGIPAVNTVSHDNQIFIGSSQFTINAEPYSYVGLSMNGELLAGGLIESSGILTLDFPAIADAGSLDIVVTRQNHEPYITEIMAVPNEGAFLSISDYMITSDNGDEIIDFSENIELSLDLENVGTDAATGITAVMSINDPYITITSGTVTYNQIASGAIETISGFTFSVAEEIPDQYSFQAEFEFSYDLGGNEGLIAFTAAAPELGLGNVYIISDDNNNGRLDPGETAEMELEITNSGSSTVESVLCMVSTTSEYITVSNTWSFIPQISPGSSGSYPFLLNVSENCPVGEAVTFMAEVTAETNLSHNGSFSLNVGMNLEDFESGNLTAWEWTTFGDADWFVTSSAPYQGTYCVESGDIGNSQITSLAIELDVLYDDEISFYRKVSSEANWDYLFFYIDGEEMGSWSGNQGWAEESYPVAAGTHEFSWVYDKDGSVSSGSDCVWLDYIIFPPIGIPQPPEMTCSIAEINQTIELNSTLSEDFTITNSGGGTLYYYLNIAETDRNIQGSTLTCDAQTYIPGDEVTWNLEVYNNSGDAEWLTDIIIDLPAGVNVLSATDFTGGSGDLLYNGATGNGATVEWNDPNGGWGQIHGGETASASVTVIIGSNQTGDLELNWTIIGDDYGTAPHQISGTITLTTEILPLEWAILSQYSGILNAGQSDDITITFDSTSLEPGIYTANLIINDNRLITEIPITLSVGGDIAYGDIDDNSIVESLDASLALQYTVGIDPAPFAPLPWEGWRLIRADVDGNGTVEAYDASLILQYVVSIINSFPVEDTRFAFPEPAEVTYMLSNQSLILNSQQDVYSLLFSTGENDILSEPLFTARDAITAFEAGDSYKAAMALSEPVSGNLISIPLDLENIDTDLKIELWVNGNRTSLIITQEELYNASLPQVTTLAGNYPNPFNPSTTISYQLAEESLVNLSIYNIKGQHITTLVSEIQHPGTHTLQWQGTDDKGKPSPSGIYLYRLSAGENIFSRKMILLK